MDKIIPIRISENLVKDLDDLVLQEIFRNRNEGIREGIRALIRYYNNAKSNRKDIAKILANFIQLQFPSDIHTIILFGSVAYNKDTPDSDIDLFILTRGSWTYAQKGELFQKIVLLLQKLDVVISLHFEDIQNFYEALNENLIFEREIYENGIILCGEIPLKKGNSLKKR